MNQKVRVLIADDLRYVRDGLKAFLAHIRIVEVVGEAANSQEVMEFLQKCEPDVVLLDIDRPIMDGFETTRNIKNNRPDIRVIVLTMYASYRRKALETGADDVVLKGSPAETLQHALLVSNGKTWPGSVKRNDEKVLLDR